MLGSGRNWASAVTRNQTFPVTPPGAEELTVGDVRQFEVAVGDVDEVDIVLLPCEAVTAGGAMISFDDMDLDPDGEIVGDEGNTDVTLMVTPDEPTFDETDAQGPMSFRLELRLDIPVRLDLDSIGALDGVARGALARVDVALLGLSYFLRTRPLENSLQTSHRSGDLRRLRARFVTAAVAVGGLLAGTVALAGPASAAPSVTVTPSESLNDGQQVTVSGSDLPSGQLAVTQCGNADASGNPLPGSEPTGDDCNGIGQLGSGGVVLVEGPNFTTPYTVRTSGIGDQGRTCISAAEANFPCVIVVATTSGEQLAFQPIYFGETAPQPEPEPTPEPEPEPAPEPGAAATGQILAAADGGIFVFGDAGFYGSAVDHVSPADPVVDAAATPSGNGYWVVTAAGEVLAFGDAGDLGDAPAAATMIVAIVPSESGDGYWLAASDGGVFAFGDAAFAGSAGAIDLNQSIVGMAADPDGSGYWLLGSDGGVFSYGAAFAGSTGDITLVEPVVDIAADLDGSGYWLVASDGGVFSFDATFHGSTGAIDLVEPIVDMVADPAGGGYWLVASDGGVFAFDVPFLGSLGDIDLVAPIVGIDTTS